MSVLSLNQPSGSHAAPARQSVARSPRCYSGGTVILSPHPDDAALSLAGTIAAGLLAVPLTIVTVFDRTDFAGPGARGTLDSVSAMRAREDSSFCVAAGADLRRLGMSDACVRHPTLAIAALFEQPVEEPTVTAELLEHLDALNESFPDAQLVAPAGAGRHVDHTLLSEAARSSRWRAPLFYADQPYASRLGLEPVDPVLMIRHTPCALRAKMAAAAAYPSQPATFELVRLLHQAPPGIPIEWVTRA